MEKQQLTHIGGHPLIDFINTEITSNGQRVDLLATNEDVIFWLTDIGLFTKEEITFDWQKEDTLLDQIRTFRQKMRAMIANIVNEEPMTAESVKVINDALTHWQGQPRLSQISGAFESHIDFTIGSPAQLIAVIADTAVDFLTTADLRYVKQCNNGECIRYFVDTSKNHSRRWCSMEGCGNRMKARAHYARQK